MIIKIFKVESQSWSCSILHYINVLQSLHRLITSCVAYFQITNRTDKIAGSRILNKQDQGEPYHLIRGFSSHLFEFCLVVRYSDGIDHGRVNATVVDFIIPTTY